MSINPVFEQMRVTSKRFLGDEGVLQDVVFALDALRMNSDLPAEKLDEYYSIIEEINGVRLYQRRQLSEAEIEEIADILCQLESLMRAAEERSTC